MKLTNWLFHVWMIADVWCFVNDEHYESMSVETNVKGSVRLPCNKIYFSEEGENIKLPSLVIWYKYGITSPIYSVDFRNKEVRNGRHWSFDKLLGARAYFILEESVLSIEGVQETDAGIYKCRIDFDKFPTKNYIVNLSVIVPPQEMTIVDMSGSNILMSSLNPVLEGETLKLLCTAHGGRPAPRVLWWLNEKVIDDQSEIILNNQVQNILSMKHLERQHHGSILKCEATNGRGQNSISSVVVIKLYLRPLKVQIISTNEIFSTRKEYEIICESSGSRPPANISWWLKNMKIPHTAFDMSVSADQNITRSIFRFQPKPHFHNSKLSCMASNRHIPDSEITDSKRLKIHYAPIVKVELGSKLNKSSIHENADVYFDCVINANPQARKVYWTHNGGILVPNSAGIIISNQTLVLQSVKRRSAGNYCCVAANVEGETQSDPFYLNVKYEPVCSSNQQIVYGAIRLEKIEIACSVEANPAANTFKWKFNNSIVQAKDMVEHRSKDSHSVATYQPKNELDYGTLLCWAANEVGMQQTPCIFHVIPAGKPDTPYNCTIANTSSNAILIKCEAGFDGGLPQEFICEVISHDRLLWNMTNRRTAEFSITGLEPGLSYMAVVYASNGKGRSIGQVELHIAAFTEVSERQTGIAGFQVDLFSSVWILILCGVLLFLVVLLSALILSVVSIKKRNKKSKRKKLEIELNDVVQPEDDRNPDLIPQITEVNTCCSRRPSATSHITLQQRGLEFTTYNTFTEVPSCHHSYTVPVKEPHYLNSVVQWLEPALTNRYNQEVIVSTLPSRNKKHSQYNSLVMPHKESSV